MTSSNDAAFRAQLLALGEDLAARSPSAIDRAVIEHRARAVLRRRNAMGAAALSAVTIAAIAVGGPAATDTLRPAPVATPDARPAPSPTSAGEQRQATPAPGSVVTDGSTSTPAPPATATAAPLASGPLPPSTFRTPAPGTTEAPSAATPQPSPIQRPGLRNGPARPDLSRLRVYRDGDVLRVRGPVTDADGAVVDVFISWTGGTGGAYTGLEQVDPEACRPGQPRTIDESHPVSDLVSTEVVTVRVRSLGCDGRGPQETEQRYVVP